MNNRLLIFTGAGISAESGLSTFRDKGGLWTKYDINEVCNLTTFKLYKDNLIKRQNIFNFYNEVKTTILTAQPNHAHKMIAFWQKKYGIERVKLFTANIDDLFEKAGCKEVIHLHGDIMHMHCVACSHRWDIGQEQFNYDERCPKCNSKLTKPNVVFFNEQAPKYDLLSQVFHLKRRQNDDMILYIGSSMHVIPPSRLIQSKVNKQNNILLNLDKQDEDHYFDHQYYGKATEQIDYIDKLLIDKMK